MLVLSRQRDETIMIGDEIEITVVDIRGDKVRLGINAPARIAVHRKEVYDAIRKENEQAALAARSDQIGQRDLGVLAATIAPGPAKNTAAARANRLSAGSAGASPGTLGPNPLAPNALAAPPPRRAIAKSM